MPSSDIQIAFSEDNILVLNVVLALIMFGVSLDLRPADFKKVLEKPSAVLLGLFIQYLVLPALTIGVCVALDVSIGIAYGLILVMVSPGGNMSNFLTKMAKGDVALSVVLTAITTISAAVMTPKLFEFWSSFLQKDAPDVQVLSMLEMAKIVLVLTAIPLVTGMLFNYFLPKLARKIEPIMKNGSLVVFFLLLILAFVKNKDTFLTHIGLVFGLVALVNAIALSVGYFLPSILGSNAQRNKAISIEAGIKNSGLSLVLVFNFWDGWGEPALVAAWWGIWHLLSGALFAWWCSKR